MSLAVACVVRNEEPIIGEWIAFHLDAGFERVLVYDNDSNDRTREIVRSASADAPVELIPWERSTADFQDTAYADAMTRCRGSAEWLALIDADEFLAPGRGWTVRTVLDELPHASAVAVNWAIFGSGGRQEPASGLVVETYLMRSDERFGPNLHTKAIVRPDASTRMVNCHMAAVSGAYVDPEGSDVRWQGEGLSSEVRGWERLKLNHYFVRSRADWEAKMRRGYRDAPHRPLELFDAYDQNLQYDAGLEASGARLRRYPWVHAGDVGLVQRSPTWLPEDFDAAQYLLLNPDVAVAGFQAEEHWRDFGRRENRLYKGA